MIELQVALEPQCQARTLFGGEASWTSSESHHTSVAWESRGPLPRICSHSVLSEWLLERLGRPHPKAALRTGKAVASAEGRSSPGAQVGE